MHVRSIVIIATTVCLLAPALVWGQTEESKVEKAFYDYKAAIMNDRGEEAANLLSSATVQYYAEMRDLALFGTRAELEKLSTINLFQALGIRFRVPVTELKDMSGLELLRYAIRQGWVGKNSVAPFKVQAVHVVEATAIVDVVSERESGMTKMPFVSEGNQWKLDLMFVIQASNAQLELQIEKMDKTREEFIFMMLSSMSGKEVDETIWEPPFERPRVD